MTENSVQYNDVIDGSILTVKPVGHADYKGYLRFYEGYLRFEAVEADADHLPVAVDLTRADVQNLIQYALEWLEDTKPKAPTTPGSVVRVRRSSDIADIILTRLSESSEWYDIGPTPRHGGWISQNGTFWTDDDLVDFGGHFEVIYDAGKAE